jgi:hypothetical protein
VLYCTVATGSLGFETSHGRYLLVAACRVGPRWTHAEYAGLWASCKQEERYWIEDVEGTIPSGLEVRSRLAKRACVLL